MVSEIALTEKSHRVPNTVAHPGCPRPLTTPLRAVSPASPGLMITPQPRTRIASRPISAILEMCEIHIRHTMADSRPTASYFTEFLPIRRCQNGSERGVRPGRRACRWRYACVRSDFR